MSSRHCDHATLHADTPLRQCDHISFSPSDKLDSRHTQQALETHATYMTRMMHTRMATSAPARLVFA